MVVLLVAERDHRRHSYARESDCGEISTNRDKKNVMQLSLKSYTDQVLSLINSSLLIKYAEYSTSKSEYYYRDLLISQYNNQHSLCPQIKSAYTQFHFLTVTLKQTNKEKSS